MDAVHVALILSTLSESKENFVKNRTFYNAIFDYNDAQLEDIFEGADRI